LSTQLFVANLAYRVGDADLHSHFSQVGEVVSARVVLDRETQRSRGFGFVEMASADLAQAAISQLSDSNLLGRPILVRISEPKGGPRSERGPRY